MTTTWRRFCTAAALVIGAGLVAPTAGAYPGPAGARPDDGAEYQRINEQVGPALVTVKFVLKVEGGGQMSDFMGGNNDSENEVTGVMIDAKGLVLCSNSQIGGYYGMMGSMMGGGGVTVTPTDVKVLIGDDTEGLKAKVLARDTELDLAWIQIDKPGDKDLAFVDLTRSSTATLGQRLLSLGHMGKFFDRAPVVSEGKVCGIAHKPRHLYVPSSDLSADLGLPVFTADGLVVGLVVLQIPDAESSEGGMGAMMGGGFRGGGALILPAEEVVKATKRARETAKAAEGEKKSDDGAKPAPAGEKPKP